MPQSVDKMIESTMESENVKNRSMAIRILKDKGLVKQADGGGLALTDKGAKADTGYGNSGRKQ
jgi:Mn-dependent DtxR family transcriptional regulator